MVATVAAVVAAVVAVDEADVAVAAVADDVVLAVNVVLWLLQMLYLLIQ